MPATDEEDDTPPLVHEPNDVRETGWRSRGRNYLSSKQKHYAIMALVSLDVMALLTDILITLVMCELGKRGQEEDGWVETMHEAIKSTGLVFSALFLVELILSIWAFGFEYVSRLVPSVPSIPFPRLGLGG